MAEKTRQEKVNEILRLVRNNPYKFICDYAESIYPHIGRKVFEILSLIPPSIITPDLPFMGKKVRSNINCLFLAGSGAGKTSIAKLFEMMTLNPLCVESITPAGLEQAIQACPKFTMIVGDFARMAKDPIIIKILEGILGEEKSIKRRTATKEIDIDTEGSCLLCGTPQDLSHYLSGGLLFRVVPIVIIHTEKEHTDIGRHIVSRIGEEGDDDITEEAIKIFFKELEMSQLEEHPNIPRIKGYFIPKKFKEEARDIWIKKTEPIVRETNFNFLRGLQEFFRFLVSHAFLNIYNRKVENGILYPIQEDFDVAIGLMVKTIDLQHDILKTEKFAKTIKNLSDLKKALNSNIDTKYKEILKNLVNINGGRVKVKK